MPWSLVIPIQNNSFKIDLSLSLNLVLVSSLGEGFERSNGSKAKAGDYSVESTHSISGRENHGKAIRI